MQQRITKRPPTIGFRLDDALFWIYRILEELEAAFPSPQARSSHDGVGTDDPQCDLKVIGESSVGFLLNLMKRWCMIIAWLDFYLIDGTGGCSCTMVGCALRGLITCLSE
jgi:hypothetical protein